MEDATIALLAIINALGCTSGAVASDLVSCIVGTTRTRTYKALARLERMGVVNAHLCTRVGLPGLVTNRTLWVPGMSFQSALAELLPHERPSPLPSLQTAKADLFTQLWLLGHIAQGATVLADHAWLAAMYELRRDDGTNGRSRILYDRTRRKLLDAWQDDVRVLGWINAGTGAAGLALSAGDLGPDRLTVDAALSTTVLVSPVHLYRGRLSRRAERDVWEGMTKAHKPYGSGPLIAYQPTRDDLIEFERHQMTLLRKPTVGAEHLMANLLEIRDYRNRASLRPTRPTP